MPDDASSGPGGAQVKAKHRRPLRPLLFVIPVVVGALSGLTCDALTMARERARRARCRSHLECCGVGYGCHLYSSDFGGAFPPTLGHLYPNCVSDGAVWLCPSAGKATRLEDDFRFIECQDSDGKREFYSRRRGGVVDRELIGPDEPCYTPAKFGDTHTGYVYVSGLRADDPPGYVLAFDDEWNHDGAGVNVCFIDGRRVKRMLDIGEVHELLAKQEKELAAKGRKMKMLRPAWSSWPDPPPGGHPLWGPRPWHKRRGGRAVLVGVIVALVVALPLIIRTVRRGR